MLLELNQLELPEDFQEGDLDGLRAQATLAEVRTDVVISGEAAGREVVVVGGALLFVIHFLTAHGEQIALGLGGRAIATAIKETFRRLWRLPDAARVGVMYADGRLVVVEARTDDELIRVVRALGPRSDATRD